MSENLSQSKTEVLPISFVIAINSSVQIIFLFLLVAIGLRLQRRTALSTVILESLIYEKKFLRFSKKWLIIGIRVNFIIALFKNTKTNRISKLYF